MTLSTDNDLSCIGMAKQKQSVTNPRKRILAIAYACNPYRGSEHGVGWGWLGMITQDHEVWCICSEDDRSDIEKFCSEHPDSHYASVHYVFVAHCWSRMLNRIWPPYYLWQFQRQWQRDAYDQATRLHAEYDFDLCHLITYVGYRIPGEFYKLDCPFVWGPIGGLENTPWHLLPMMGPKGAFYYGARNLINSWHKRFLRRPKNAFQKAAVNGAVIAATTSIQGEIKKWYGVDGTVICEIGPPPIDGEVEIIERKEGEPLRLCWSGQHQPGKALPLLLKALAKLPEHVDWRLDVLGDGVCRKKWMRIADKFELNDRITWRGLIPRADAVSAMKGCHLFVITSLKDLTSSVLLEAISLGKPVIAPDHCGFSDVIKDECGAKIPIYSARVFTDLIRKQIESYHDDEQMRQTLSFRALERIQKFTWVSKKRLMNRQYCYALKVQGGEH